MVWGIKEPDWPDQVQVSLSFKCILKKLGRFSVGSHTPGSIYMIADPSSWHLSSSLRGILKQCTLEYVGYACNSSLWHRHSHFIFCRLTTSKICLKKSKFEGFGSTYRASARNRIMAVFTAPELLWWAAVVVGLGLVCMESWARVASSRYHCQFGLHG